MDGRWLKTRMSTKTLIPGFLVLLTLAGNAATSPIDSHATLILKPIITKDFNQLNNGLNAQGIHAIEIDQLYYAARSDEETTNEIYLVARLMGNYPVIVDHVEGFDPRLTIRDLNNDGKDEVIEIYHVGGHGELLKIYVITTTVDVAQPLRLVAGPKIGSGLSDIRLIKGRNGIYKIVTIDFTPPFYPAKRPARCYEDSYEYRNKKMVHLGQKVINVTTSNDNCAQIFDFN